MSLCSGAGYPEPGLFRILSDPETVVIAASQVVLGVGIAHLGRSLETECRLGIIFRGALAIPVAEPQIVEC